MSSLDLPGLLCYLRQGGCDFIAVSLLAGLRKKTTEPISQNYVEGGIWATIRLFSNPDQAD